MFVLLRVTVTAIGIASALAFSNPLPASASEITAEEAARKVNLAGRQRMLSQRMLMSACYATLGIESDLHFDKLTAAHASFEQVHDGLRYGDPSLDLHEEGYRSVMDALTAVDERWADYNGILTGYMSVQMLSGDALYRMNESSLAVLRDMNAAVSTIANSYSADLKHLPQILAVTIDLAGRQRMLTQKMAKELCLVKAGVDPEQNLLNLAQSYGQFNATLDALVDGIPLMVAPAPTEEIANKLAEVREVWQVPAAIFAAAAAGEPVEWEDLETIVATIDTVLFTMNEAVGMYETVDTLPNY